MRQLLLIGLFFFLIAALSAQEKVQIKLTSTSPSASLQQRLGVQQSKLLTVDLWLAAENIWRISAI
jgi:biopolymer transport protein ExbD